MHFQKLQHCTDHIQIYIHRSKIKTHVLAMIDLQGTGLVGRKGLIKFKFSLS